MRRPLSLLLPLALVAGLEAQSRRATVEPRPEAAHAAPSDAAAPSLEEIVRSTFDPNGPFDDASGKDFSSDPAGGFQLDSPGIVSGGGTWPSYAGAPANDDCLNPTVIPGNTVSYSTLVSTVGALTSICESATSCESGGVGTSASVWWSYAPDQDGTIIVDTLGSDFDTVLSIYDGCSFYNLITQSCVGNPIELVCNDDYFFGQTSRVTLDVAAGQTYLIKVATVGQGAGGGLCDLDLIYLPPNDACAEARTIPGVAWDPPLLSTHWATVGLCEALESCEFNNVGVSNTVWYSFLAPCDGLLSVNTNGSTYDTILSIFDGCGEFVGVDANCIVPAEIACDDDSGTGLSSQLYDVPVQAGVEYRIKVADYNTSQGGGWLDFNVLFSVANPPTATITSPAEEGCVCGLVSVLGSAGAGNDPLAQWRLDVRPTLGGAWTTIAASTTPVSNSTLAVWDTTALPAGPYLLRLTVENGCGFAETDIRLVYVDQAFDDLELRSPQGGVFAGSLTIDGTAWDTCFASYDVEVRPTGDPTWSHIGASPYAATVIDDPLVPGGWDTTTVGDGDWIVRLTGFDQCGHSASESATVTIDNTPPIAEIQSPLGCQLWRGNLQIVGTASDANLKQWRLEYTGGGSDTWTLLAEGDTSVVDGPLSTWNVGALPDCAFTLRLVVVSAAVLNGDDNVTAIDMVSGATYPAVLQPKF